MTHKLFSIELDSNGPLVDELYKKAQQSSSKLINLERWDISTLLKREVSDNQPATFAEMLPLWIGNSANKDSLDYQIKAYVDYLKTKGLDEPYLHLLKKRKERFGGQLEADLSIPQDFLFISKYLDKQKTSSRKIIVEVGGGFGVLAEQFVSSWEQNHCYIIVDAVPESCWFQYAFLKAFCSDKRIGASFNGDQFDTEAFDIFILPAWEAENTLIGKTYADAVANVASIQEMPDETAREYFRLFDKILKNNGLVFFQNSREFFYKREYEFPINWKYVVKEVTPRSRTWDYPLDLLVKREYLSTEDIIEHHAIEKKYYQELKKNLIDLYNEQNLEFRKMAKKFDSLGDIKEIKSNSENYIKIKKDLPSIRINAKKFEQIESQLSYLKLSAIRYKNLIQRIYDVSNEGGGKIGNDVTNENYEFAMNKLSRTKTIFAQAELYKKLEKVLPTLINSVKKIEKFIK